MRQKKLQRNGKTLRMAFVFLLLIVLLVTGSFLEKVYILFRKSLFDGGHRINVLLQDRSLEKDNNILISFAPDQKNISTLDVQGVKKVSPQKLAVIIGVPIDGFIIFSSNLLEKNKFKIDDILSLLQQGAKQTSIEKTNLTFFDFVRLWFFVKSIPTYQLINEEYRITDINEALSDQRLDRVVVSLFADDTLSKEKVSVQIINASGVTGLGNRLARLLTNSGGNVVAVSTGNSILPKSEIAFTEKEAYTFKRISRILPYNTVQMKRQSISDIIITLGKDKAEFLAL